MKALQVQGVSSKKALSEMQLLYALLPSPPALELVRVEMGGLGRTGSSGETEARFSEEHWEGAGPDWYLSV